MIGGALQDQGSRLPLIVADITIEPTFADGLPLFQRSSCAYQIKSMTYTGDGVDAALTLTASRCAILVVSKHKLKERASMGEVSIIGVDLAKNVFQVHGAAADGSVLFRKKLSRPQFARFMADQPPCLVAMEACASAHHWAREMSRYGHEVRLIAPHYV